MPLTAIPVNANYSKRLTDSEDNTMISNAPKTDDNDIDSQYRRSHTEDDEDPKIPLLTSPEVISRVARDSFFSFPFPRII